MGAVLLLVMALISVPAYAFPPPGWTEGMHVHGKPVPGSPQEKWDCTIAPRDHMPNLPPSCPQTPKASPKQ